MSITGRTQNKMMINHVRPLHLSASVFLALCGIGLGIGHSLHLASFTDWVTLAVAGSSLFAAGALWSNRYYFSILSLIVAIGGAILCTSALPGQFDNHEYIAAVANLAVIVTQVSAAVLIWYQTDIFSPFLPKAR